MSKTIIATLLDDYGDGIHGTPVYSDTGEYYFINGNNLNDGRIQITNDTLKIDVSEYLRIKRPLNENTLLMSINGTLGKIALYRGEKIALGKSACFLNATSTINRDFIRWVLSTTAFRQYMMQVSHGSTIKNLAPSQIAEYEFQDVQDKEHVVHLLNSLDNKIDLNNRICAEMEAMAKTLYDYWFMQFDFPDENGKPYRTSGGAMEKCKELGREVPKGWKIGTLSDFVSIQKEGFDPSGYEDATVEHYSIPAYDDEHYPSFDPANTILSGKYAVPLGSILFSKLNPQFKRIWNPPCLSDVRACSTEFMVYLPVNEALRPFIYATLNSDAFYRFTVQIASSSTGSRKRLDPDATLKYAVLKPDSGISQQFCNQVKPIIEQVKKLQIENHELKKLRDWLLPMLMNGQARIP